MTEQVDQGGVVPRERPKGTVRTAKNGKHLEVRLTLPNGKKSKWVKLPPGTPADQARDVAARMHDLSRERARAAKAAPSSTWDGWAERWFAYRRERGQTSVRQDEGRWRTWISPEIGHFLVQDTNDEHMRRLVARLDKAQRAKKIRPKTADLTWGVMTSAGRESCSSKRDDLRVRKTNPCAGVQGPDPGPERDTAWLYPIEAGWFFRCARVPLRWRQLAALAIGLYLRPGEMETIGPDDVDLLAGVVLVHQAADPTADEDAEDDTKLTKTRTTRRVPIEPMILPLVEGLVALARAEGRDRIVSMPPESDMAENLRIYLLRAGCTRAELHANDRARRPLRWRDLRNTGITWRALRGDPPLAIQRAAGHKRFATTERYINAAADLGLGVGAPFPELPPELLELGHFSDTRGLKDAGSALKQGSMRSVPSGIRNHGAGSCTPPSDADPLFQTPIGALDTFTAHKLAAAVSDPDTRPPPADLAQQVWAKAEEAAGAFARGDVPGAREAWRDLGMLLRFGGTRRRGALRYETHPETGETLTVSEWARRLDRTSQALTYDLDHNGPAALLRKGRAA